MAGWGYCKRCRQRIWWGASPYDSTKSFPFDHSDEQQSHFETCAAQEWVTDSSGDRHRVNRCRMCNARIWWDTTPYGKRRPMDCNGNEALWDCHIDTCAGVPPGQRPPQPEPSADPVHMYLAHLGLAWPCTEAELTTAYRRLARVHHPDVGGQASEFIRIKLAYDKLKDLLEGGVLV